MLFFGPNILANVYLGGWVGCFGISSGFFFEGMIPFMEGKGAGFQIIHQTLADSSRFFLNFISLLLLRDPGYCSRFPGQQRDVILQFMKGFKLAVL